MREESESALADIINIFAEQVEQDDPDISPEEAMFNTTCEFFLFAQKDAASESEFFVAANAMRFGMMVAQRHPEYAMAVLATLAGVVSKGGGMEATVDAIIRRFPLERVSDAQSHVS